MTKTNVGAKFASALWLPARPAQITSRAARRPGPAAAIAPGATRARGRAPSRLPRAPAPPLQLRLAPQHRQRDERDDEHDRRRPAEEPLRDREVGALREAVGRRGRRSGEEQRDGEEEPGARAHRLGRLSPPAFPTYSLDKGGKVLIPMRIRPFALTTLVAALVAAGCGGASDERSGGTAERASGGSGDGSTLSLVAYSTPQVVYDEIIPAFQKTENGKGARVQDVLRRLGRAEPRGRGRPPRRRRLVLDRARHDAPAEGRPRRAAGRTDKGLVTTSRRLLRRPQGQPEEHQDVGRPPQARASRSSRRTRSPRGAAKWNLLGAFAHGGLDYVEKLITEHVKVQPKSGREALQTFTSGEGDVLLSYEYEATTAQKKGEDVDVRHPRRHAADRHHDRATTKARRPRQRSWTTCARPAPAALRRLGLPPRRRVGARGTSRSSRPEDSRRSTTSAAGRRSTTSSSIPRTARSRRSRRRPG